MQKIRLEQNDKTERWMWQLMDGEKHICMSGIRGFETMEDARDAAKIAFSQPVEIEGEYGTEYAGEREFSD